MKNSKFDMLKEKLQDQLNHNCSMLQKIEESLEGNGSHESKKFMDGMRMKTRFDIEWLKDTLKEIEND